MTKAKLSMSVNPPISGEDEEKYSLSFLFYCAIRLFVIIIFYIVILVQLD